MATVANTTIDKPGIRALFDELAGDHPQRFFDRVADHVSWDVLGTHPLAGHYPSKAEFYKGTIARLGGLFDAPLKVYVRDVLLDGTTATVQLYTHATTRAGVPFNNEYCWVCRFDGPMIVAVRAYLDSALVATAFAQA